ncbi:MAG: oligosaccharyl transferase, archaeosortase A system-associated [Methanomicrobiales archaeon]|nr:oligosaccharyl transferase, archaeosortase A system-associated [Methanomicrobiales archaeon]MDI6876842.1 oligosaccharyl transferase, archaeosortase A system-associated [Methanomicrobiales archaeon]
MTRVELSNYRSYIIAISLVLISLFTFWIRVLPSFAVGNQDILNFVAMDDPFYNLRQVEHMLRNFPTYSWFDPMSQYPYGSPVNWGPVMTYIASFVAILLGASTRPEIAFAGLITPPLLAAAMVPVMYAIGRIVADWKTGLIASLLIAVVSGQYFYRSLFGYFDHHIAEALFSALFALGYIYTLNYVRRHPVDFKRLDTLKVPAALSVASGILYLLGLFTMPTMILFALIVAVFTVVQFVVDFWKGRSGDYLLLTNLLVFSIASIGLAAYGFRASGLSLISYSFGHIVAYGALMAATVVLYALARFLQGRPKIYYPAAVAAIGVIGAAGIAVLAPAISATLLGGLFQFFGQPATALTVQEAQPWSFAGAWYAFNYGLILMVAGIGALLYWNVKEERSDAMFALVWSLVILVSTIQHVRYEYYMAVNVVLLSAVAIGWILDMGWKDTLSFVRRGVSAASPEGKETETTPAAHAAKRRKKEPKEAKSSRTAPSAVKVGMFFGVAALALLFISTSFASGYSVASSGGIRLNPEWKETLEWMHSSTPDPGVDYYGVYDRDGYQYPPGSYGVMSWWDYGHIITYIAKRIPNANPFQAGVAGPTGASTFFITQSEDTATGILDTLGTRYVITDIEMDIQKFWAMATWYNSTLGDSPYRTSFLATNPENPSTYQVVSFYTPAYYSTMISRLHNFDGSLVNGSRAYYVEYQIREGIALPVLTNAREMPQAEAQAAADAYNQKAPAGYRAAVLNTYPYTIYDPLGQVPALRHFRLVHESPTNIFRGTSPDIKYVKVFEYVPGAHIRGEGIIEIDLVSNTGRNFTYRQQSQNGEFVVPYSTSGSPYDVRAVSKYRLAGTGVQFDVPEEAVMQGTYIN